MYELGVLAALASAAGGSTQPGLAPSSTESNVAAAPSSIESNVAAGLSAVRITLGGLLQYTQ